MAGDCHCEEEPAGLKGPTGWFELSKKLEAMLPPPE